MKQTNPFNIAREKTSPEAMSYHNDLPYPGPVEDFFRTHVFSETTYAVIVLVALVATVTAVVIRGKKIFGPKNTER